MNKTANVVSVDPGIMPMTSTFLYQDTIDRCVRKAVEWCEDLLSQNAIHVGKIEMSKTIGVTLKDGVWHYASDMVVVAEVVTGKNSCVFLKILRTLYPC